jgi:hypothetical protein
MKRCVWIAISGSETSTNTLGLALKLRSIERDSGLRLDPVTRGTGGTERSSLPPAVRPSLGPNPLSQIDNSGFPSRKQQFDRGGIVANAMVQRQNRVDRRQYSSTAVPALGKLAVTPSRSVPI